MHSVVVGHYLNQGTANPGMNGCGTRSLGCAVRAALHAVLFAVLCAVLLAVL
jgi:hypothetical protein